jgi:peroxiredoxin Q/BCP
MMKAIARITCTVLAVMLLATIAIAADQVLKVGSTAPDFTLPNQDGKQMSLSQFRGKWVVLYFYPKDFTKGCTIEARGFQRDMAKYEERNAEILGVSLDTEESHKSFCEAEGLRFHLLADPKHVAVDKYKSLNPERGIAQRTTFLINPEGKIARVFTGVDPNHHSEEVLTVLDEARMAKK